MADFYATSIMAQKRVQFFRIINFFLRRRKGFVFSDFMKDFLSLCLHGMFCGWIDCEGCEAIKRRHPELG
jgi:hypothetical protein